MANPTCSRENADRASTGRAGFDIVPDRPPGFAALPAQCPTGLPRDARCGLLSRLRGRPPARHRRGRSPFNQPTSDHADGATLGRWDARASQRPRRPGLRAASGTAPGFSVRISNQRKRQRQMSAPVHGRSRWGYSTSVNRLESFKTSESGPRPTLPENQTRNSNPERIFARQKHPSSPRKHLAYRVAE